MYQRVIPRDLFNEAKLLKCLGQLALLIHNGLPLQLAALTAEHDYTWKIDQRQSDGGLYICEGLQFKVRSLVLELYTAYNSKARYPLLCMTERDGEIDVFNYDGTLADEFRQYVISLR